MGTGSLSGLSLVGNIHESTHVRLRPFVFADVIDVIEPSVTSRFVSAQALKGSHGKAYQSSQAGGEALSMPGIAPSPGFFSETVETFGAIGGGMPAGLRDRLAELTASLWHGFAEIGGQLFPDNRRKGALLAYGLYQNTDNNTVSDLEMRDEAVSALERRTEAFRHLVSFLLYEKWFRGRSLIDLLSQYWGQDFGFDQIKVHVRPLGYPDGYYRPASQEALDLLSVPSANGGLDAARLAELLPILPARIDAGLGNWRLISWDRINDFPLFRKSPEVWVDAGLPLLGLAEILVHELCHHVFYCLGGADFTVQDQMMVWINRPVLNEGFAEYHAARVMSPVVAAFPALDRWRVLRHTVLHSSDPGDLHIVGAALFTAAGKAGVNPRDLGAVAGSPMVSCKKLENGYATPAMDICMLDAVPDKPEINSIDFPDLENLRVLGRQFLQETPERPVVFSLTDAH